MFGDPVRQHHRGHTAELPVLLHDVHPFLRARSSAPVNRPSEGGDFQLAISGDLQMAKRTRDYGRVADPGRTSDEGSRLLTGRCRFGSSQPEINPPSPGVTQIYLSEDEVELLDREVRRTGASRSELIRRAIRERFGQADVEERRRVWLVVPARGTGTRGPAKPTWKPCGATPTNVSATSDSDMRSLDTMVAVDHLRGAPTAVRLLDGLLASGQRLVASEIVRFELLAAVRDEERSPTG